MAAPGVYIVSGADRDGDGDIDSGELRFPSLARLIALGFGRGKFGTGKFGV